MNTTHVLPAVLRALVIATLLAGVPALADEQADAAAAAVIEDFNAAITARDMDTAMDLLAEGSVQFQLRAVHPGMSDNPPLTADLRGTWKAVAGILFPMSETYERTATVTQATALGEVATVWADTTTRTLRKGQDKPTDRSFSEVYLLVKKPAGWKIAGLADNRQRDNIRVDGAAAP
jgi:ketosteroid isomerase-like protein